jgi:ABC-2 type transport system ATP-binding protein
LVEVIAGLIRPGRGTARVCGLDPIAERAAVRRILGVQLQEASLHYALTVRELVRLHCGLHPAGADPGELIDALNLSDRRDTRFESLSGGEAQRVSIAVALAGRPRVALLDHGRVLAVDTPAGLVARTGRTSLDEAFLDLTGETR